MKARKRKLAYRLRRFLRHRNRQRLRVLRRAEQLLNRGLFGQDTEPDWGEIRDGARAALLNAQGVDPAAARKIWEDNRWLPPELRTTNAKLLYAEADHRETSVREAVSPPLPTSAPIDEVLDATSRGQFE